MGRETDALIFLDALAAEPYRFDFYQTMRRLECLWWPRPVRGAAQPETRLERPPRWGRAQHPSEEPVRLGQEPEMSFAPAPLSSLDRTGRVPRLNVRMFGLMGPNGPLPLHLTEYARDRLKHHNDPTFVRFLDTLQHRFIALFYRAWAQAQPHVNYDRPKDDHFATYLGAFAGLALDSTRARDAVADEAKRFFAGRLGAQPRSAEGLRSVLAHYFRVPVTVQEFVGHWMPLAPRDHTRLSHDEARLGMGAVIGARVWDRQHKFRVHIGPLERSDYESFLPGGVRLRALVDWVRLYLNLELEWDVRLVLERTQVPPLKLGTGPRLGWTTWLGDRRTPHDANELCLNAEAFSGRSRPL